MKRRTRIYKSPFRIKLKKKALRAVSAVILYLAAIVILLSFFNQGLYALKINSFVNTFFGWGTIFVPVVLLILGSLLNNLKAPFLNSNVFLGVSLLLTSLLALTYGGSYGDFIRGFLNGIFSTIGAFLILFLLSILAVVIIFNTSLDTAFVFIGEFFKSAYSFVKNHLIRSFLQRRERPTFRETKFEEAPALEQKPTHTAITNLPSEQAVWNYPPMEILSEEIGGKALRGDLKHNASVIEKTLDSFGIQARVVEVNCGPAVTQYALELALGTKLTKVTGLSNDIAMALAAPTGTVRIEAPIPGKSLVGIEVPNISPEIVPLKKILTSEKMQKSKSKLSIGMGLNVSGQPVVDDLARMPHVLIAGATGSGKSVFINGIIATFLFRTTPNDLKLILIDPKIVELSSWNGIPHLLTPVITDPEKVLSALKWATVEMDRRYKMFAEVGARNLDVYNEMSGFQALPYIVIIIDELADLMIFAPVEIEDLITRLAQMSRAVGIHLVLATQRPSVDVITGLIKANIPCRIAFNVAAQVDSRVIIDQVGSEKLLGKGDMLYVPPDASKPIRIQGLYVSEPEINRLIEFMKKEEIKPQYIEEVTTQPISKLTPSSSGKDEFFEEAVKVVCQYDRASASLLQRRLRIGYARAARLLDELEAAGVVGVGDGSKARDVLVKEPERVLGGGE